MSRNIPARFATYLVRRNERRRSCGGQGHSRPLPRPERERDSGDGEEVGAFCLRIALNLLGVREDADECVNDTYLAAWTRMPPELPASLRAFLGRITRNLSISRYRLLRAQKRYAGMDALLSELDDCVPAPQTVEQVLDAMELTRHIEYWLGTLPERERRLFVRRYWYGEALGPLAAAEGMKPAQLAQLMLRLRRSLRAYLEAEGAEI